MPLFYILDPTAQPIPATSAKDAACTYAAGKNIEGGEVQVVSAANVKAFQVTASSTVEATEKT